jgi:hypothetical protein
MSISRLRHLPKHLGHMIFSKSFSVVFLHDVKVYAKDYFDATIRKRDVTDIIVAIFD